MTKAAVRSKTARGKSGDGCESSKNQPLLHRRARSSGTSTSVPPIVYEVLRSTGQPLPTSTRAEMEPRFGHDFGKVRVHTDEMAAQSARAVGALAYTVGQHMIFDTGRHAPNTEPGRELIAHELAHTIQQGEGGHVVVSLQVAPASDRAEVHARGMARRALDGAASTVDGPSGGTLLPAERRLQRWDGIPQELLENANLAVMSDEELQERYDLITDTLSQFSESTADTAALQDEAGHIGVELARRKALAEGRTFSEASIEDMRKYFIRNAKTEKDSCIVCLNKGMKLLLRDPKQPTTPKSIEKTMEKVRASGRSSEATEIWFEGKNGRITTGAAFPAKLHESVAQTLWSMAGGDPGWSVFTMSLMDGFHSVTITLDNNDPASPKMYWSDQWKSKKGWKQYTREGLDAEVTKLIQGWWRNQAEGSKHNTVVRLWRLRQ